jgi:hypothetical protein
MLEPREASSDCMPSRKLPDPPAVPEVPESLPATAVDARSPVGAVPTRPVPDAALASVPWPAIETPWPAIAPPGTPISIPVATIMR